MSEEVCKIVPVRLAAWKHPAFDYRFDAVVYSVSSALGFAAVENILYVVQSDLRTAVSRAVLSVPGHFFFAVAMGLLLSRGKQAEKQGNGRGRTVLCALAVLVPVVLHGVWDLCLAVRRPWATVVFYCFVVTFFLSRRTAACAEPHRRTHICERRVFEIAEQKPGGSRCSPPGFCIIIVPSDGRATE